MTRKMVLTQPNDGDLLYILRNLREQDRREIFATRWSENLDFLVDDCMGVAALPTSYTVMAGLQDKPIAILGAVEPWPGCWDVWCFGTDQFDLIAFSLTKHIRRVMIPTLLSRGLRRGHCRSLATHTKAHAWLHDLGARPDLDRPLKSWGKGGEDFVQFEWHRADLLEMLKLSEAA